MVAATTWEAMTASYFPVQNGEFCEADSGIGAIWSGWM
jgi:hypothetical protein